MEISLFSDEKMAKFDDDEVPGNKRKVSTRISLGNALARKVLKVLSTFRPMALIFLVFRKVFEDFLAMQRRNQQY